MKPSERGAGGKLVDLPCPKGLLTTNKRRNEKAENMILNDLFQLLLILLNLNFQKGE